LRERNKCPYFSFLQNPTSEKGRGSILCEHASPNIGNKTNDRKHCDEGKPTGYSHHTKKCRILSNFLTSGNVQTTMGEYVENNKQ